MEKSQSPARMSCHLMSNRLLPSRVGFAERDASRPAFGGRSVLVRRSAATSALGRSAAVRERRSLRGAAQRSSGDDHVGLSFQNQRSPREPASTSSLPQHEVESSPRLERQAKSFSLHGGTFFLRWFLCSSPSLTMPGRTRGRGTSLCPVSQVVARRQGATSFFGFLPSGPTRSLDATDHRLG